MSPAHKSEEDEKIALFQQGMLDYWYEHGRHNLPWRITNDPWKLLLAEVLLRKTTSGQAADVYRQLEPFSAGDATAMDGEILKSILRPLGIHEVRSQQIKAAAQTAAEAEIDMFRSDAFLRSISGIGRYISNAVRCCAFGIPVPTLDTRLC